MRRKRKLKKSWLSVHWPILGIGTAAVRLCQASCSGARAQRRRSLRHKPEQCRRSLIAQKKQSRFQTHLSRRTFARRTCEKPIKLRKKFLRFWLSSLAIAIASGKATAVFWIVSKRTTQSVAKSASRNRCLHARCIGKARRPRRSGQPSFKDNGRLWRLQLNDCDVGSTT